MNPQVSQPRSIKEFTPDVLQQGKSAIVSALLGNPVFLWEFVEQRSRDLPLIKTVLSEVVDKLIKEPTGLNQWINALSSVRGEFAGNPRLTQFITSSVNRLSHMSNELTANIGFPSPLVATDEQFGDDRNSYDPQNARVVVYSPVPESVLRRGEVVFPPDNPYAVGVVYPLSGKQVWADLRSFQMRATTASLEDVLRSSPELGYTVVVDTSKGEGSLEVRFIKDGMSVAPEKAMHELLSAYERAKVSPNGEALPASSRVVDVAQNLDIDGVVLSSINDVEKALFFVAGYSWHGESGVTQLLIESPTDNRNAMSRCLASDASARRCDEATQACVNYIVSALTGKSPGEKLNLYFDYRLKFQGRQHDLFNTNFFKRRIIISEGSSGFVINFGKDEDNFRVSLEFNASMVRNGSTTLTLRPGERSMAAFNVALFEKKLGAELQSEVRLDLFDRCLNFEFEGVRYSVTVGSSASSQANNALVDGNWYWNNEVENTCQPTEDSSAPTITFRVEADVDNDARVTPLSEGGRLGRLFELLKRTAIEVQNEAPSISEEERKAFLRDLSRFPKREATLRALKHAIEKLPTKLDLGEDRRRRFLRHASKIDAILKGTSKSEESIERESDDLVLDIRVSLNDILLPELEYFFNSRHLTFKDSLWARGKEADPRGVEAFHYLLQDACEGYPRREPQHQLATLEQRIAEVNRLFDSIKSDANEDHT